MKKERQLILLLIFTFSSLLCSSQVKGKIEGAILFHGLIMDAGTELPLANSQIFINKAFTSISDNEGKFAFYVNRNDTVTFMTLGYRPAIMTVSDTLRGREFITGIFMVTDTVNIPEVVIIPRIASLKSDLLRPPAPSTTQMENAKYNVAVSAYQGRVNQGKLGDPEMNYELIRQKQRSDAYSKGQIPSDRIVGISPLLLLPAAYLLVHGLPEKPSAVKPAVTDQEADLIRQKYLEEIKRKK